VDRLPVRWKVTSAFATALLAVLAATGAFLYLRLRAELRQVTDRGLQAHAAEVVPLVERSAGPDPSGRLAGLPGPSDVRDRSVPGLESDESLTQIIDADGRVIAADSPTEVSLAGPGLLRAAGDHATFAYRVGDGVLDEGLRLLAVPAVAKDGGRYVVLVGASSDETAEALKSFVVLELIGLGGALLASGAAGYLVAGVALRPVEAMRRRAEQITGESGVAGIRLPVPPVDDELGRLGRTMNAMLERLEVAVDAERRAIAKERRFIADASHELRTPLTIIKSEVEVAMLDGADPPGLLAALSSTAEETDRLTRLTDGLLLLARTDEGVPPAGVRPVAVRDLVRRVAARHLVGVAPGPDGWPGPDARPVQLDVPDGLSVVADPLAIEQVLGNLLDNAVRHGGGTVEISGCEVAGGVRITVRDHGPGFPDGFADRAFERFSRADAGRAGGGTGLGLAIVDAVVRAHGGTVEAGNAGPGARVSFTLPG
jgi:signal transduction histidine kinase